MFSSSAFKQSLRRLARERSFTTTALLTLAVCIGANVAIFAVVDAILVRPLPYPEADRLVLVRNSYPGAGAERSSSSLPNYYNRRGNIAAMESISIVQSGTAVVGEAGSPQTMDRGRVSPDFWQTLGVPLAMGRTFTEDETFYGNHHVVIVTHEFWQDSFPTGEILGQTLTIDGQVHEVIGVTPPGLNNYFGQKARFFMPLASDAEDREITRRHSNNQQMIARLAPGATIEQAQAQIDAFNEQQLAIDPYAELIQAAGFRSIVASLHDDIVNDIKPTLLLLQAGVGGLLLIGAVNLINLLLIRTHGRAKEFAVRQALGAGRGDLAKQIISECLMIAAVGGLLGLGAGALGIKFLATLGTDQLPLGLNIAFDNRLALVSLGASLGVGLLLSLPILLVSLKTRLAPVLQAESRGGTISRAAQNVRHGFMTLQIALTFMLLAGAGLLGLSMKKVMEISPGFQAEKVLTGSVQMVWQSYPETDDKEAFLGRLLGELRAQPGVSSAAMISNIPFGGNHSDNATVVEGIVPAPGDSLRTHHTVSIYGDYWTTMGIPLLEGRFLNEADQGGEQKVAVVDQEFVRRYWPDGSSAIGRRFANDVEFAEENAITIVGVVANNRARDLTESDPLGTIFHRYQERPSGFMSIVLRTELAPEVMAQTLRKVVTDLDPTIPVDNIQVMQSLIDDSLVARRSPAVLAGVFAGVALLLAAVGSYGVLAYAVGQRRREIGVRMALGALPSQILRQFLSLGTKLLVAGISLGVALAWLVGRAMQSLLYDVEPFSFAVLGITGLVMALVVLLASLIPSRQASLVSPNEALRDE
ncbi:MAG: ABC transporter permease [Synoicihabitans sp.]